MTTVFEQIEILLLFEYLSRVYTELAQNRYFRKQLIIKFKVKREYHTFQNGERSETRGDLHRLYFC